MRKPTRRKVVKKSISEDDFISQLEQGAGVSAKSQKMLKVMQSKDADKQSEVHDEPLFNSGAFFDLVLLEYIQPQDDNPRYLPIRSSKTGKATDISALTDCIVCEKGIIENRLNKDNDRYDEVEREIESIKTLAESIRHNGLVQPITVWRGNMTNYPIVSGHRRYYATCYLYGRMVKIKTKIYPEKPNNVHILRHVENFARADLSPSDALRSYKFAMQDLTEVLAKVESAIKRKEAVTNQLGISQTQYYKFEKLTEYEDKIIPLFDRAKLTALNGAYSDITKLEKKGGVQLVNGYLDYINSSLVPVKFDDYLASLTQTSKEQTKSKGGRQKQYITMPKIGVEQSPAIYRLLKEDITTLDTGIDWETIDKDDPVELEKAIKQVIKVLCLTT